MARSKIVNTPLKTKDMMVTRRICEMLRSYKFKKIVFNFLHLKSVLSSTTFHPMNSFSVNSVNIIIGYI